MRCIPREMLIHTAEIRSVSSEDCFGKKLFSESTQLKFIRIDDEDSDEKSGHNFRCTGKTVLIYDMVSSVPRGIDFSVGQEIVYDGAEFRIRSVKKLFDKKRLHHIEAELEKIREVGL